MTRAQRRARNTRVKVRYTKIICRIYGGDHLSPREVGRLVNSGVRRKTDTWKTQRTRPERRDVRRSDLYLRETIADF